MWLYLLDRECSPPGGVFTAVPDERFIIDKEHQFAHYRAILCGSLLIAMKSRMNRWRKTSAVLANLTLYRPHELLPSEF